MTETYTFLGLHLSELNLFITDMVMTAVALFCFITLRKTELRKGYTLFFIFTAFSAFISGFGHLLNYYTDHYLKVFAWIFSLMANYFMLTASIQELATMSVRKSLNLFAAVKMLLALSLLMFIQKFAVVSTDTIVSIGLVVLPIHLYRWKQTQRTSYKLICIGIVFTMLTGIVTSFHISLSENWFNDKDLNHLIICGGMLWMRAGMKQL